MFAPVVAVVLLGALRAVVGREPGPVVSQPGPMLRPPHRWARVAFNGVGLGVVLLVLVGAIGPSGSSAVVSYGVFALLAGWIEVRTLHLAVIVRPDQVIVRRTFTTARIARPELLYFRLEPPGTGAFTPGGGERLVATLRTQRPITVTFDCTRSSKRPCEHFAQLLTDLHALVPPIDTDAEDLAALPKRGA